MFLLDVALVTSLRDGMNLVSYEYVACQASKKGVLILSEVTMLVCFVTCHLIYCLSQDDRPKRMVSSICGQFLHLSVDDVV